MYYVNLFVKRKSFLGVLLLCILIVSGCSNDENSRKEQIRYVKAEEVTLDAGQNELVFSGKVKEKRELTLSFRVGGPLATLRVEEGDYVRKGQVIATIDQRDYALQLESTRARYQQSEAEFNRYKELFERKKVPANTFDQIKAAYLMAKSSYDNAVNALKDTELLSPISGYVHSKFVENFERVGPGKPIVSLIDMNQLEVAFFVPESQIKQIGLDSRVLCDIVPLNRKGVEAKVLSIGKKANQSNLYEVKVKLTGDHNNDIKPGMTTEARLMVSNGNSEGVIVPVEAIFYQNNSPAVWVLNDAKDGVSLQSVQVKRIQEMGTAKVIKGVDLGDWVVTAGVHSLTANQQVRLLQEKSATNIGGEL